MGRKEEESRKPMKDYDITGTEKRDGAKIAGKKPEEEKAYLHWLVQTVGPGGRGFLRALDGLGAPREIYGLASSGRLADKLTGRYRGKAALLSESCGRFDVQGEYARLRARGIRLVSQNEAAYPRRLLEIPDRPYALYAAGALPPEGQPAVALIGARDCTEYGRYMAGQFGAALAGAGVQVISGMARGIDGIGQESALREGGYSMGVLGCGVDICYPRENGELYEALLAGGGVCSEYPPGVEPRALFFPPRNRIISGLADAVMVIEARERSGTLITVDMALEQGREVYALPGRATDPLSGGCNRLIRQGAGLVSPPEELLRELPGVKKGAAGEGEGKTASQMALVFLEGTAGELLAVLDFYPLPVQELQRRYEEKYGKTIAIPALYQSLLELCAQGYAGQAGGGSFVKILKS